MVPEQKKSARTTAKTVSMSLDTEEIREKKPVLLFTAGQIDEILAEITIQALPFVPEYFLGLCAWREQVLPIIAPDRFFGLRSQEKGGEGRYVVVRTVDTGVTADGSKRGSGKKILRCVLKVSDQIITGEASAQCKAVHPERVGLPSVFIRGLFLGETDLFILPDLTAIIHSNSLHDVKNDVKKRGRGLPINAL